jgi:argininosuccinate lyase
MIEKVRLNGDILSDPKYDYLFTVEEVNRGVLAGVPFREAYKQVGVEVNNGTFSAKKEIAHTHMGSTGNLCNDEITAKFRNVAVMFGE